jgi:hypothetical protein
MRSVDGGACPIVKPGAGGITGSGLFTRGKMSEISMELALELANNAIQLERAQIVKMLRQWAVDRIEVDDSAGAEALGGAADQIEAKE